MRSLDDLRRTSLVLDPEIVPGEIPSAGNQINMNGNGRRRSSKACEGCRSKKRRCRPPYPCRFCRLHGRECIVREKARPQRAPRDTVSPPVAIHDQPSARPFGINSSLTTSQVEIHRSHEGQNDPLGLSQDPFNIILQLTENLVLERYGHELRCELVEPKQSLGEARLLRSSQDSSVVVPIAHLTLPDIRHRLHNRRRSKNSLLDLVDIPTLDRAMTSLFQPTTQIQKLVDLDINATDTPLDHLSLAFATLALALGDFPNLVDPEPLAFLHLSMSCAEEYPGRSTFELALALFLQHTCVLRTATSNRSRALIIHAVQVAHDLGINRGAPTKEPLQGLKFYLLLYFADQYCAMTYNTTPCIKPDDYAPDLFNPLVETYPHLSTLIDLLILNGRVFCGIHSHSMTQDTILSLESSIGEVCCRIGQPSQNEGGEKDLFVAQYSTLARIHMFWSRIMLRAPLIPSPEQWLVSLTICIRASQMLLSIYFDIFGPAIQVLPCVSITPEPDFKQRLRDNIKLPPTWRQVHRIATSILIIMYGLWKGEVSTDEAARCCACALLLLDFQRIRWTNSLTQITNTVRSTAAMSGLDLRKYLTQMLPLGSQAYIEGLISPTQDVPDLMGLGDNHDSIIASPTVEQPDPLALFGWECDSDLFTSVPYPDFSSFVWD